MWRQPFISEVRIGYIASLQSRTRSSRIERNNGLFDNLTEMAPVLNEANVAQIKDFVGP